MRTRIYASILALVLVAATPAEEESDVSRDFPMTYSKTIEEKGTKIEITITMRKFDWTKNKVEYNTNNYEGEWKPATPESPHPFRVNGKQALGTDAGVPGHELQSFSITWGGKKVELPEALWRDCFQLFMWSEEQLNDPKHQGRWGTTNATLSESGKTLMIESFGGGGAGSYKVTWIIPRNGSPDRFIENLSS
jgi:hypothetical protein